MKKKIAIVGAGLVGSLLAPILTKRGHIVKVFERRDDMRKAEVQAGRSINLAMSDRGFRALRKVGFEDEIMKIAIPMKGRMIHDMEGNQTFQAYGSKGQAIYSVSRGELNMSLMNLAEESGAEMHFNLRCKKVDVNDGVIHFEETTEKFDHIIGTDGAFSAVRSSLSRRDRVDYSQMYLKHGYKELTIPAGEQNDWLIDKNALHIWPRGEFMLIALPNLDGSFTCTLFAPFAGNNGFDALKSEADVKKYFQTYFSDALRVMPTLIEDFFGNPTSSLVTIKCFPWSFEEKVLIMGDASHAIVPFYGQGMNSGFEDVSVFAEMIEEESDWKSLFEKFEQSRKPNADAISDLALQNFIEMRDRVGDEKFLLRKKFEKALFKYTDGEFLPVYEAVTFTHIPYAEAWELGLKQERFFTENSTLIKAENIDNESIISDLWSNWCKFT